MKWEELAYSLLEARPNDAVKLALAVAEGKPPNLKGADLRALVELELDTGRTHQIRVHMAHIGHPLTGDFLYGTEDHSLISRPALHSARLSLRHPVTGEPMAWEQPLPEDMARLV